MNLNTRILETEYGSINYSYSLPNENYPTGLLLFMGSYVKKEFRGCGRFKDMVKTLFLSHPEKTLIQVALANKNLVKLFERIGFKRVKWVEHWGLASNTTKLDGILTIDMINKI